MTPPDLSTEAARTEAAQAERAAVLAHLHSPHVSAPTRRVLLERLDARHERRFFTAVQFAQLRALAVRLLPHDPAELDLCGTVDHRLHAGVTDGWRYDDTPPDGRPTAPYSPRCRRSSGRGRRPSRTRPSTPCSARSPMPSRTCWPS